MPTDHLAVLTDCLNAGLDLHRCLRFSAGRAEPGSLLIAVGNSTAGQVIRGEFNLNPVPRKDSDVVHSHLPRNVRENFVPVLQFDTKHRVFLRFEHCPLEDDCIFLRLGQRKSPDKTFEYRPDRVHPKARGPIGPKNDRNAYGSSIQVESITTL